MSDKLSELKSLRREYISCTKCQLSACRDHIVFASGSPDSDVVLLLERPSEDDSKVGKPLQQKAESIMLHALFDAAKVDINRVHVTYVVMCPTPENRVSTYDEVMACRERLLRQIYVVDPYMIIAVGSPTMTKLMGVKSKTGLTRGTIYELPLTGLAGNYIMPVMLLSSLAKILQNPGITRGGEFTQASSDIAEVFSVVDQYKNLKKGQ